MFNFMKPGAVVVSDLFERRRLKRRKVVFCDVDEGQVCNGILKLSLVCLVPLRETLCCFPPSTQRPQSLFSTMSMKGSCAKEIVKLSLVCSVPLREMVRCLPRSTQRPQSCLACQFCNGILKLFLCVLRAFAGNKCANGFKESTINTT